MAKGGFDIEMDPFAHDADPYYDDDPDKYDDIFDEPIDKETSFTETGALPRINTDTRIKLKREILEKEVNKYYRAIEQEYKLKPWHVDLLNFELGEDNKTLLLKTEKGPVRLTSKIGGGGYVKLSTLEQRTGINAIRNLLNLERYKLSKKEIAKLNSLEKATSEIMNAKDEDLPGAAETLRKEIETTFPVLSTEGTQTIMTKREMDGVIKAMTDIRDELTNNLAKLSSVDKDLMKEKRKLEQAKGDNDDYQIKRISNRIKDLESERSARMEVINNNREQLRSQVNRIRDTIHKVLNEDTTLRERIGTLFKEQGITIVSILTAIGMTIGVIVEALIPRGTSGGTPTPSPKPGESVKDWIKKQLSNLGKLLGKIAGKVAEALPGVIGAIVSWLLSTTGKVISWVSENLWALLILVVGLLFAAAKEYISKSRR